MSAHLYVRAVCTPGSEWSHVASVLSPPLSLSLPPVRYLVWSVGPSVCLSVIADAIAVKHLISLLMVLPMDPVYFLSQGLEAVTSPVPETEQPGRALVNI